MPARFLDEDDPRIARHEQAEAEALQCRLNAGDPEAVEERLTQLLGQWRDLEAELQCLTDIATTISRLDLVRLIAGHMRTRPLA